MNGWRNVGWSVVHSFKLRLQTNHWAFYLNFNTRSLNHWSQEPIPRIQFSVCNKFNQPVAIAYHASPPHRNQAVCIQYSFNIGHVIELSCNWVDILGIHSNKTHHITIILGCQDNEQKNLQLLVPKVQWSTHGQVRLQFVHLFYTAIWSPYNTFRSQWLIITLPSYGHYQITLKTQHAMSTNYSKTTIEYTLWFQVCI